MPHKNSARKSAEKFDTLSPADGKTNARQPQPSSSRWWHKTLAWFIGTLGGLLGTLLILVVGITFYAVYTEQGTRHLWQAAVALSAGHLNGTLESGTLRAGIKLKHFNWHDANIDIHIDTIRSQWTLLYKPHQPWRFIIDALQVGTVDLRITPSSSPSPQAKLALPENLTLPLQFEVRALRVDLLRWHQGELTSEINQLLLHARTDGHQHQVTIDRLVSPWGETNASFKLESAQPFTLVGDIGFVGNVEALDKAVRLQAHLSGSLQSLIADIKVKDMLTGDAHIEATPFNDSPLKRITLSVAHLNPHAFFPTAPAADLSLQATLRPGQKSKSIVEGPVSIVNARPGALDAQLLPLVNVYTTVALSARKQTFSNLQVRLIKHALLTGDGWLENEDGQLNYAFDTALKRFNPWLLFKSPQRALQTTRLSGNFKLKGTFAAPAATKPTTTVTYALHDSRYGDLPLTGAGTIKLMGARMLPSDAQLSIAGNKFAVLGSFGGAGDRLTFRINAPQLARLGFGLAGAAYAAGDVRGTLAHPHVTANVQAHALVLGENRVGDLRAQTKLRDGVRGAMMLTVEVQDLVTANATLQALNVHLTGTRAKHVLAANAIGQIEGRGIDLTLAAHGSLINQRANIIRWEGVITQFVNRVPSSEDRRIVDKRRSFAVRLESPVTVRTELNHSPRSTISAMQIGAMRLFIDRSTLYLRSFVYHHGSIQSVGSLTGIEVHRLLEMTAQGNAPSSYSSDTDLVFDSDWDFSIGATASGYWQLQRRLGDLRFRTTHQVLTALNMNELTARVSFSSGHGNRAHLAMHAKSAWLGTFDADLQALLTSVQDRLTITNDTAVSGQIIALVPSLKTTGGLLGPKYLLDGDASLKLTLAGSVGQPKFSGMLMGDHLSATLIDEGITLKDGLVRIAVSDNLFDFKQVEFHGASGVLRATGRIRLDKTETNPDLPLSAQIIADKFEPFATPYRQLSLSGQANIVNSESTGVAAGIPSIPTINGQFTIDHALFDLPEKSAPQLGDDVQVVYDGFQPVKHKSDDKPSANKWMPRADIHIDFGHDFRFHGVGANLKLGGALNVISAPPKPLRAVGDLRVLSGSTYEIFGRKLGIEKGYFAFNGPINNPGINILAMRRNQEVEAGVAVTGTVARPNSRLVSEPNVPDDEKLSWLLFGHGPSSGVNLGQQSTMTAALALLGSTGSKRIARTLGVDEFSVGQSESGLTDPQVVSLAKAINEHLILGYEQGLTSAANLFKITWQISRGWSLAVHTGTINGVDLIFSRHFD